jgi:hypothetical protein
MAESKIPDINERNKSLFVELEAMDVGETVIYGQEEHRILDYLRAIQGNRNIKSNFKVTLCTGALVIHKIG